MQQYLIHAWDGTDEKALERRMAARPAHLDGAKKLKADGNYVLGGAMLSEEGKMIGSTMIVRFDTEAQLRQWLDAEPYITSKVWQKVAVHPFRIADV